MEGFAIAPSDSVQISIEEWMKSAGKLPSKNAYVESAVNMAWMLTKNLLQIVDNVAEGKAQDSITTENVVVIVERPPLTICGTTQAPFLKDVKFRFEAPGVAALEHAKRRSTPCRPRSICVALGKILLKIFSRGRSCSMGKSNGHAVAINGNSSHSAQGNQHANIMPPAKKRQAMAPTSSSMSAMANDLLLDSGMPQSICRLVCDLLDAESNEGSYPAPESLEDLFGAENEQCPNSALTSLEEAVQDLTNMKNNPQCFLFDRTCPKKALDDTHLSCNTDGHLFGREKEIDALMTAKNIISSHVHNMDDNPLSHVGCSHNVLCEAIFLRGYAGSGKSALLHSLISACNDDQWFVISCKFDKNAAPHMVLAKAFDDFFGRSDLNPSMAKSFQDACGRIFSTIDSDGFDQLCDLIPNFAQIFPLLANDSKTQNQGGISSMEKFGSAKKRLQNLFGVLFKSLCSVGRPVLFAFDDLQWAESSVIECVTDFVTRHSAPSGVFNKSCRQGLLIAGAFRSNEVKESDDLIQQINLLKGSGKANVTNLTVGDLVMVAINRLISAKFCLPSRYTKELAGLVLRKTRGNIFFVIQFLKSIIHNNMLEFSVKSRRWIWDNDTVDMQVISDGVAELLTTTLSTLPSTLMQTLKIVSCFGSQVEESTIDVLNSSDEILHANMHEELQSAVKEGIMEKAGPMHQFAHDIVQQTVYDLIPAGKRILLHKVLGLTLLKSAGNNPVLHLLAVDQINIFCKDGNPNREERLQFARANALATKFAIAASSFDQARSYVDIGIKLLGAQHWNSSNYYLSLDLFEMSASVCCMHGDTATASTRLDEILSHARTFDDSLKASGLLVKVLASKSKFEEVRRICLETLSNLGEVFPSEASLPLVLNEMSVIQPTLMNITYDQMKQLPPMTDSNKLHAMKFMNMLSMYSVISEPMLVPILSCRMVTLMLEYGTSGDAIVGLATAGYSVFLNTDDLQLASQIGKVSERLVTDSPKKHVLRSRLSNELVSTLNFTKPFHPVVLRFPELYNSAMLAGDIENAIMCRWNYCGASFFVGNMGLVPLSEHLVMCIKEAAKYQQNAVLYATMAFLNSVLHLSNLSNIEISIKSYDELGAIAERTKNIFCVNANFMCRLSNSFWMRDFMAFIELSENHSQQHPTTSQQKRLLSLFRIFYEGVAALSLARDTKQAKYRKLGQKAVVSMAKAESMAKCNFENKSKLLQAELHYLDGQLESAESSYKASIKSAGENKFIHEEALSYELYGIFCVENHMVSKGSRKLRIALDKYKEWGAMAKANELQLFIDLVHPGAICES